MRQQKRTPSVFLHPIKISSLSHLLISHLYKLVLVLLNHPQCNLPSFLFSHSLIHATPNEQQFPLK